MFPRSGRANYFVVSTLMALLAVVPVSAGTGVGISDPAIVDTRPPVANIEELPPYTFLQGGNHTQFNWVMVEDNPQSGLFLNSAQIWIDDELIESQTFSPFASQHSWNWSVPDFTSTNVYLQICSTDLYGNFSATRGERLTILSSATDVPTEIVGTIFAAPAPNPFNPLTQLKFSLPESGQVQVTVHDARGSRVNTLWQGQRPAGLFELQWNGTDQTGHRQAGGLYFFRLEFQQAGQMRQIVKKAILLP